MTGRAGDALRRLRGEPEEGWFFRSIGAEVLAQRKARRISQQQLAELCGTTQSAIARFEGGRRPPRLDTLLRIAEALDCELVVELRPRTHTEGGRR